MDGLVREIGVIGEAAPGDDFDRASWVEVGFSAEGKMLFHHEWSEKVAAWRVMNDLLTGNYAVAYSDANTLELRRADPARTCRRLVLARLWPYLRDDGAPAADGRAWPSEEARHVGIDPLFGGDRALLRAWLADEAARCARDVAEWESARAAYRLKHGRDQDPLEDILQADVT